jgi:hypothetical protein
MNETERLFHGPAQGPSGGRLYQPDCCDKRQCRDGAIDNEPREERSRVLSQREKAFQQKQQQRKNANRNHRSDMFHFGFAQVDHVFARRNYYSYSAQDVW